MIKTKKITYLFFIAAGVILCWSGCKTSRNSRLPDAVSYNFNIRPILSDKCFKCHGPDKNKQEAGLRLDIADSAFAPLKETKGAYAIVPGKPLESEMYKRIISTDPDYQMPVPESHLGLLSPEEIALIEKWIKQGAKYERHWAFTAPVKTNVPVINDKKWARNEIDYFIADKMQSVGLSPNEQASKDALIKRISLDITGFPAPVQSMDAFENAVNEDAQYEKAIDSLLSSPAYGEKMAVHWMDLARYSDSYGYQDDNIRTQWPYRDWVIHAFNNNMRYDSFLVWQLAGDLLPKATNEQILATAFLRNHKYTEEGGVIPEEYRIEYNIDKVKTYAKGLLALTAECAQCHDHKYDPISQKEYYQLFAFFNSSKEVGYEGDVSSSMPAKKPFLSIDNKEENVALVHYLNRKDTSKIIVSVMGELDTNRVTHILNRGAYDQPGDVVTASAIPAVLKYDTTRYPKNRLGLAEWTVNKENPLTARVFVNQIWQEIFGNGIVKTAGDFGMQGNLPTHPQLLDWLAVDFMEHNWDIKYLVKKILMSATYRQSAQVTANHIKIDPENIYLARAPRTRLKGEFVRDMILATSGLLSSEMGGPSVKPYQPAGLWESATSGRGVLATYQQDTGTSLYRRGLYTFIKLTVPPPSHIIFDGSNRDQCEVKRVSTNTPLQALAMMNDPLVLEASRVLAQRLITTEKNKISENIIGAFRLVIGRRPDKNELEILAGFYDEQQKYFSAHSTEAEKLLRNGATAINTNSPANQSAALMKVVNIIYNMDEAISKP